MSPIVPDSVTVVLCYWCGENHGKLEVHSFDPPFQKGDQGYPFYFVCPTSLKKMPFVITRSEK